MKKSIGITAAAAAVLLGVWALALWLNVFGLTTRLREAAPPDQRVLQDLFGTVAAKPHASIWHRQSFILDGDEYLAVIASDPSVGVDGKVETCHACAPTLSIATYKPHLLTWKLVRAQVQFLSVGSFGKPPESKDITVGRLGKRPLISISSSGAGQGYTFTSLHLLAFDQGWRHVGSIGTYEDNHGTACDAAPEPGIPGCYQWSGTLAIQEAAGDAWPDIILNRTGTVTESRGDPIASVKPVTYAYDGINYVKREILVRKQRFEALNRQSKERPTVLQREAAKMWATIPVSREHLEFLFDKKQVTCTEGSVTLDQMNQITTATTECAVRPPCTPNPFGFRCKLMRLGFASTGEAVVMALWLDRETRDRQELGKRLTSVYGEPRRSTDPGSGSIQTSHDLQLPDIAVNAITTTDPSTGVEQVSLTM